MKQFLLILSLLFCLKTFAQIPEDAIRYSWQPLNGSARFMATGGVMGSLGGEITAAYVNPAGLGLFKTGEFVFSPFYKQTKNKTNFRSSTTESEKNALQFGPMGVIIGIPHLNNASNSSSITFAFNKNASFNNHLHYSGMNNYSSFSEQFAEEFAKSNLSINDVLSSNSTFPYTSAPALYTYLMDTVSVNGLIQVKTAPEYLLDSGVALLQDMDKTTNGGIYEFAISYASNYEDKWLYGVTLGFPIIDYKSKTVFTETDISGDTSNGFNSFSYTDNFETYGSGINLKLGVIYRPKPYIRLGLAIHTPNFMTLKDTRTTTLTTSLENPIETFSIASTTFTNDKPGESKYAFNMPWKAIISGSYVFREIENVKKQRAFISADLEYVRHKASRFFSNNENPTKSETGYYDQLNKVVKNEYKSTINFRVGGELKFNVMMCRLGFAYYSNPYKDLAFKANNMRLSGGIGYRNNGYFIDLTYVHSIKKDVDLPYRLSDRANTFANTTQTLGNIYATFGLKF